MNIQPVKTNAFQSFYAKRRQLEANINNKSESPKTKQNKPLIAGLALIGATLPIALINIKRGRGKQLVDTFKSSVSTGKEKFKSVYNMFEMKNYTDLLSSTTGAIAGGILGGVLTDKNPKNRKEKYKEGIFAFLNNMIPTTFVAMGEAFSKKTGKMKSAPAKALMIASSVAGGMFIANKASNKINEKIFDKNEKTKEKRKFKISDCFVHADDILGLLVLAKIPLAKVIHADKILPLLYTRSGYEAGSASKSKGQGR